MKTYTAKGSYYKLFTKAPSQMFANVLNMHLMLCITVSLVLQNVWLNHNHAFLVLQFGATRSIALSNTFTIDLAICTTNTL